jgi:L-lactate permease
VQVESVSALEAKEDVPHRWWNAVLPISIITVFVLLALILTGKDVVDASKGTEDELKSTAQNIFGEGNSYQALLWSTFFVSIFTWFLYRFQFHHDGEMQPFWKKHKDAKPIMTLRGALHVWDSQLCSSKLLLSHVYKLQAMPCCADILQSFYSRLSH